jgi:hypothetical protein
MLLVLISAPRAPAAVAVEAAPAPAPVAAFRRFGGFCCFCCGFVAVIQLGSTRAALLGLARTLGAAAAAVAAAPAAAPAVVVLPTGTCCVGLFACVSAPWVWVWVCACVCVCVCHCCVGLCGGGPPSPCSIPKGIRVYT